MAKMRTTLRMLLFLTFVPGSGSLTRYISHVQNFVNLVSSYNLDGYSTLDFPPLADVSQTMVVNVDIHLYAVNGFDEVAGNIELVVALDMTWVDEMSIIHSITFKIEDRREFLVPFDMIWTPKLVLTNAIGESSDVGNSAYLCRFDMATKKISWKPRVVVSGSCTPDVTFYPFDKQECDFVYTAWGFNADEILLTSGTNAWNMAEYGESGEWDIDSTTTETFILHEQSYIKFTLVMVRKPLYFAFNILLPILVLCLLNSTVFLLPAESGERVGFSVTCFLSFMVLLNMIMDIMPRSSNPISFLCYYLVVMMSNSGAMTLVTILLMRVYHKPEKSQVPKWMQRAVTFVNCGCARLRCCVLCCRFIRSKCGCGDQRKCGCKKKEKSVSEQTLIEITVDKDQNIIEKPAKTKKPLKDTEPTESSKCCFLSCVRNDEASDRTCCCGCIIGCKKCRKTEDDKNEKSNYNATQKDLSVCTGLFSCRKRKNEDDNEIERTGQDEGNKQKSLDENEVQEHAKSGCITGCSGFFKHSTENKIYDTDKKTKLNDSCFVKRKIKDENTGETGTVTVTCTTCFCQENDEVTNPNQTSNTSRGCLSHLPGRHLKKIEGFAENDKEEKEKSTEENCKIKDSTNTKCFGFLRKVKISSLDEADIENDVLPVTTRSTDIKTLKVSFKGKDSLDNEDTLLQRWDEATQDNTNKKGNSLKAIDQDPKNNEGKLTNEDFDQTKEVTLKTKSIRASSKEKDTERKEKMKSEDEDSEFEMEIVRKTRSRKRASEEVKENLPRPVVLEKVGIPTERRKSTVSVSMSRRPSTVSKIDMYNDEDSEEDEVDSLADLEEEVTWPEVGRILDTFFFLAFAGGQAFLTVVFLVPLFTGDTKGSEN